MRGRRRRRTYNDAIIQHVAGDLIHLICRAEVGFQPLPDLLQSARIKAPKLRPLRHDGDVTVIQGVLLSIWKEDRAFSVQTA